MKKKFILFCLILIVNAGFLWSFEKDGQKDIVTIDFGMVERGIEWLEFINAGKDDEAVKDFFMTKVAPTKGCQAIIHHWARFMKWDEEELSTGYTFAERYEVIEELGKGGIRKVHKVFNKEINAKMSLKKSASLSETI